MAAWDRPPADITAARFFEEWLPGAFAASGRPGLAGPPTVRVTLSGAGGGAWEVRAGEDGMEVCAPSPTSGPPDVWLRQSAADFRAAFAGDPDLPDLLPPGWSALDLLFLDPRDVELLRQVHGRVLVEVSGRRRRRWAFDVAFGKTGVGAGRPSSTIRLDAATFDGLRRRTLPPMQPLVDGRLKIDGDRALAMQLLLLLANRLAR